MQTGIILNGRRFFARYSGLKNDLIYLGSEFCRNLLPGPEEFGRALKTFKKRVVLVTPFLTDRSFRGIEAIIRKYSGRDGRLEIVANDLGLIHLIREKYSSKAQISLGRILGNVLKSSRDAFIARFLAENGITRIEADSTDLPVRYGRFEGVSCTYHIPYSYMAVTRFCPWEKHWVDQKCRYTCFGAGKKLTSRLMPGPLRLLNCGYFMDGGKPVKNGNIDRIVYQPSVY
ncbi:MAG: hypothetical protein NTX59_07895 [Elusimicrobia bacterium]|nr:hypothetical protein [Elusimicrobiota bacterium]